MLQVPIAKAKLLSAPRTVRLLPAVKGAGETEARNDPRTYGCLPSLKGQREQHTINVSGNDS